MAYDTVVYGRPIYQRVLGEVYSSVLRIVHLVCAVDMYTHTQKNPSVVFSKSRTGGDVEVRLPS
jgi:hypothetical protein